MCAFIQIILVFFTEGGGNPPSREMVDCKILTKDANLALSY